MTKRNSNTLQAERAQQDAIEEWRMRHGAPEAPPSAPDQTRLRPGPAPDPGSGDTATTKAPTVSRRSRTAASGKSAAPDPGVASPVRANAAVTPTVTVLRGPSGRLAVAGVCALAVGVWGAIVPFVGPAIRFNADGTPSWFWNLPHALLWLAPGAAAVVAAAAVLGFVPLTRRGRGRVSTAFAGFIMAVAGAWFVIGPLAWPVMKASAGVFVPAGPLRELDYQLVYSLGPGVLLLLFGGMVIGWGLRRRPSRGESLGAPVAGTSPAPVR